jgi:hypothetical protein
MRVPSAQPSAVPPKIEKLMDLGGLPLADGKLETKYQDERFTPAEWVAVVGQGLHDAAITLDGAALPIGGYLDGGSVLVRLPGNLAPAAHEIAVKSAAGEARASFDSLTYVIGSDTDGDKIRFLRIGAQGQARVDDPELSVGQKGTLYHALSADGSVLYGLGITDKKKGNEEIVYSTDIAMFHMGGKNVPEALGSITFPMTSHPTGIAVAQGNLLLILGTGELVLFKIPDDPRKFPEPIGKLPLAKKRDDRFLEMALLQNGLSVAVLEVNDNWVSVISIADPTKPKKIAELELGPAHDLPFSVDLAVDPTDPNGLFVLQGLNMRLGGKKVEEGKNAVTGLVKAAYDLALGKPAPEKQEAPKVDLPKTGRLIGLKLADTGLSKTTELPLPEEFLPLFCVPVPDGRFFVSGVSPGALETSSLDASIDGAGKLLGFVKDTVQLGKIAVIDRSGKSSIEVQGVAVFFDVDVLPGGELVYSGMRISGKVLPPFLAVKWGVGVGSSGFYGLQELDYGYVIPPYTYGQVSVQRAVINK